MPLFSTKSVTRPALGLVASTTILIGASASCATPPPSSLSLAYGGELVVADASTADERSAPGPDDGRLTSYLARALEERADLLALDHRSRSSAALVGAEETLPNPSLSYSYFASAIETRLGPQRHKLSLRQVVPLERFTDHSDTRRKSEVKGLSSDKLALALAVRRDVSSAYWRLWRIDQEQRIHRAHKELVAELYKTALARIEVGAGSLADAAQIDLRVTRLADMIEGMNSEREQARSALAASMGIRSTNGLIAADEPADPARPQLDEAALLRIAEAHPALESFEWKARAEDAVANRESARTLPSLSVGVDYIEIGALDGNAPAGNGRDAVAAMVGLSLPLSRDDYRAKQASAQHRARSFRAERERKLDQVLWATRSAYHRVLDSARRIELYQRQLLPQAESVYEARIGDYQVKNVSLANLLLAQEQILELRVALARARSEHERSWAALEAAVGGHVEKRSTQKGSAR